MTDEHKKGQIKTIVIVALCIVIVAAGFVIWKAWPRTDTSGVSLDPNAKTQQESGPNVAIPGWVSLTMPADTTKVTTVDFFNPKENEGYYYLTFEIELTKTGRVIYKSDLVEPGKHITEIELTQPLHKGKYDAVIHVQPYTMDDEKKPVNNADLKTEIIVK